MRKKPDISSFTQPPKDPTAFLEGASADRSEKAGAPVPPQPPAPAAGQPPAPPPPAAAAPAAGDEATMPIATVQKLFRLRWDTANALRMGAAQMSTKQARRVTETEIVESLIRQHFKIDS